MHGDHDHGPNGHHHQHPHDHAHGGVGHNHHSHSGPAQWQTPHLPEGHAPEEPEPDFDLVEQAFIESFPQAPDPTSFLRLAGIPLSGEDGEGKTLSLLRVDLNQVTDVGAITPHLGGQTYRYDPLPAKLVSKRRRLRFVYHDGDGLRELRFAEAKGLTI